MGRYATVTADPAVEELLEIARETEPVYESIIPRGAEAMLLVELQGEEPQPVRKRLMGLLQRLQRRGKSVVSYRLTTDRQERDFPDLVGIEAEVLVQAQQVACIVCARSLHDAMQDDRRSATISPD